MATQATTSGLAEASRVATGAYGSGRADRVARIAVWLPYFVLSAVTGALLIRILQLNGGKLVYTLDDAYIHLAMAENIARGAYGVNLDEPSAPASSILYPLLLAPFTRFGWVEWVPLVLGFVASAGTIYLWSRTVRLALEAGADRRRVMAAVWLVLLLIPATNLIGVMFTGMEHSVQLFVTALLVAGLFEEREKGRASWWLWAAIAVGPLIRYENLALTVPALVYLFLRGRRATAAAVFVSMAAALGGFSLFLMFLGQGVLPTSVLTKASLVLSPGVGVLTERLINNLLLRQGALLATLGALLLAAVVGAAERKERGLAAWGTIAVLLHLCVGGFGWFERYEVYMVSAALLACLLVYRAPVRRLIDSTRVLPLLVVSGALTWVFALPYIYAVRLTHLGANNIYEQQYQMHRFATEYYDGPVAVTDLGWVSFRNDNYVLDLWGLANRGAAEARLSGDDSFVERLTRAYEVDLAMLYGSWYPDPPVPGWTAVAEMRLGRMRITPAEAAVTFFVVEPDSVARVVALLREFETTLPAGMEMTIFE